MLGHDRSNYYGPYYLLALMKLSAHFLIHTIHMYIYVYVNINVSRFVHRLQTTTLRDYISSRAYYLYVRHNMFVSIYSNK